MQYFDKNAIFENYFLHSLYADCFASNQKSKNICESRRELPACWHVRYVTLGIICELQICDFGDNRWIADM